MKQQLKARAAVVASVAAVVGLVLAPVAASAVTQSTTVTAKIQSSIAISQSGNVSFNITPVSGGAQSSGNHTVTVTSNHPSGYLLTSAVNIKSTGTGAGSGDATVVNYSAKADTTKPVGAYVDTVTYTATTH